MAKRTLQDIYLEGLKGRGSTIVKELKGCIVLTYPGRENVFYFVGSAGSIRIGGNRTSSLPVSKAFKKALIETHG